MIKKIPTVFPQKRRVPLPPLLVLGPVVIAMTTIEYDGLETLSFRQIDTLNSFSKGTAFRLFKRCRADLIEGQHYYYLASDCAKTLIESLRADRRIYQGTVNLVLITRAGYERMQALASQRS